MGSHCAHMESGIDSWIWLLRTSSTCSSVNSPTSAGSRPLKLLLADEKEQITHTRSELSVSLNSREKQKHQNCIVAATRMTHTHTHTHTRSVWLWRIAFYNTEATPFQSAIDTRGARTVGQKKDGRPESFGQRH